MPNLPASCPGPSPPAGRGMTRGPSATWDMDPGVVGVRGHTFWLGTMSADNHDDDFSAGCPGWSRNHQQASSIIWMP